MPNANEDNPSALSQVQRRAVSELLRVSPVADDLAVRFQEAGFSLALVGGSVRDALLGRLGNDLDFTTDAHPEDVLKIVRPWADAVWEVGIAFGTVGCQKDGYLIEVTTYRSEAYDRTSRKPEVSYGDSIEEDLVRRDFTVNAMAVALPQKEFVDPYGGLEDLAARVLRTPGTPEESFSDDPLRMMRAARFAAQLDFEVAPGVVTAMTDMSGRIEIVSAERVRDELNKLLISAHPKKGLRLLVDTGLADHVLPELPALRLESDEHHRHKDVYEHSLIVLDQAIDLERRARPGPAPRGAAARHRQAEDAAVRVGRAGLLPPPRGGRREDDQEADGRAEVLERHGQGRLEARGTAPALPRLRHRGSGPTRRCAGTSATRARFSIACTS